MYSDWGSEARRQIAEVMASLPEDAPLGVRRKALKRHASQFHGYTSWGRKVWPKECRKYLEREHGLPPLSDAGPSPPKSVQCRKLKAGLLAGDITFPFREEGNGR